jgi:hypothetical protein
VIDVLDAFLPGWRVWIAGLAAAGGIAVLVHACDLGMQPDPQAPPATSAPP